METMRSAPRPCCPTHLGRRRPAARSASQTAARPSALALASNSDLEDRELRLAAMIGDTETVAALLDQGADVDAPAASARRR
jgi:hypothetical protein